MELGLPFWEIAPFLIILLFSKDGTSGAGDVASGGALALHA